MSVDFPAPLSPITASVSTGREGQVHAVEDAPSPARHAQCLDPQHGKTAQLRWATSACAAADAGRAISFAVGASSTMRPASSTQIRSARFAASPRSWVISSIAVPLGCKAAIDKPHGRRGDHRVERRGRFIEDQELRRPDEGHGDD